MGEVDFTGILVLELFQTAARAAVAQAFPFGAGHLFQRLGFPEESLLARGWFGRYGHETRCCPVRFGFSLLGGSLPPLQARWPERQEKPGAGLVLTVKIVS